MRRVLLHLDTPFSVILGFIFLFFLMNCAFVLFWFKSNKASSRNGYILPHKLVLCLGCNIGLTGGSALVIQNKQVPPEAGFERRVWV